MSYPNILVVGSTRSGKSMAEVRRLVEAAQAGVSLVVIDPHQDSLAARLLEHLVARGMRRRILYDRLEDLDRVLGYDILPKPAAASRARYRTRAESLIRAFMEVLCRRRQMETLATAALTEEWVLNTLWLYVEQADHPPLPCIQYAFGPPDHPVFQRLLRGCRDADTAAKFREIERGQVSRSQTIAAERLIRGVCSSPAFAARCGATFDLGTFLDGRGILIIEGGGEISDDAQQTMMGAVILHTIRYVRHRRRSHPTVILTLDEATNANLISASGFETKAAAETQKMGLAIHVLVQSLNFPHQGITRDMLTNCVRHEWFFAANADTRRQAAADLGHKDYGTYVGQLNPGQRYVKERSRVGFEYVPLLENPWGYPRTFARKAQEALAEIRQRPEYRTPVDDDLLPPPENPAGPSGQPVGPPHPTGPSTPLPLAEEPNPNLGI